MTEGEKCVFCGGWHEAPKQRPFLEIPAPGVAQSPTDTLKILIMPSPSPPPGREFLPGCRHTGQSPSRRPQLIIPNPATSRPWPDEPPKFPVTAPSASGPSRPHSTGHRAERSGLQGRGQQPEQGYCGHHTSREQAHRAAVTAPHILSPRPQPLDRTRTHGLEPKSHPSRPAGLMGRAPPPGRWWRRGLGTGRQRPPSAYSYWLRPFEVPKTGVQLDWL